MSGNITLKVQIYSDYDLIDVSYRIDSGELIPMEIIKDKVWDTAIISWDTTQVAEGYHTITIEVEDEEGFKVYVKSPPIGGKANKELIEVLAEYFKIKKREVRIIKGEKSKEKIVEIGYL
jgi:hypothetical protein